MTRKEILQDIQRELPRFQRKLNEALLSNPDSQPNKQYAAVKRAAMDLKNELTKLTQDAKLLYRR
jgi:hypothetical protein